jgi:lipoprotein-releasing system permease protein
LSKLHNIPQTLNIYRFIAQKISQSSHQYSFSALVGRIASVSIAITILVVLLSFSVLLGFKDAIKSKVFSFAGHIRIVKTSNNQSFEEPPVAASSKITKEAKNIPYIEHLQTYVQKPGVVKVKENVQGVVLKGVGKDYRFSDFADNMKAGRWLNLKNEEESNEVVISQTIADKLQLKIADSIIVIFVQEPPRFRKLAVVGIYDSGVGMFDEKFLITDIKTLQKVNNWGDSLVSGYEIFLKDFEKINENSKQLEEYLPYDLSQQPITAKHYDTFEWLAILDNNVVIILVVILAVAAFNIISVLLIMMMERTPMIGILKAMGAENRQILKIFLFKGLRIVLKGFLAGNLIAYLLYAVQYYTRLIPLDAHNYFVSYVPVRWDWLICILANIGVLGLIILVMIVPISLVVRISPIKAIRFV